MMGLLTEEMTGFLYRKTVEIPTQRTLQAASDVEMMGLLGMGNNPMVGATVAVAVAVEQAMK